MKKVFWINQIIFTAILLLIACKKEPPSGGAEDQYIHWPAVKTLVATNVDSTTAKLYATVNGHGLSTTVTFEYGTTTSYGSTVTAFQSPVTGDGITHVNADISGLTPRTTYHFRVKAENSKWINFYGPDSTFITVPKAKTLAATYVSDNRAILNGTINANFLSTTVTFEYGKTSNYGKTVTASQSPVKGNALTFVSADITGLTITTDSIYHFRIKAENSLEVVYGSDMEFIAKGLKIITLEVTNITDTTAVSGGNITGYASDIADRGVCWSLNPRGLYYTHFLRTHDGTGVGIFISHLTGLLPDTTYYVEARVYIKDTYIRGNIISFRTSK